MILLDTGVIIEVLDKKSDNGKALVTDPGYVQTTIAWRVWTTILRPADIEQIVLDACAE